MSDLKVPAILAALLGGITIFSVHLISIEGPITVNLGNPRISAPESGSYPPKWVPDPEAPSAQPKGQQPETYYPRVTEGVPPDFKKKCDEVGGWVSKGPGIGQIVCNQASSGYDGGPKDDYSYTPSCDPDYKWDPEQRACVGPEYHVPGMIGPDSAGKYHVPGMVAPSPVQEQSGKNGPSVSATESSRKCPSGYVYDSGQGACVENLLDSSDTNGISGAELRQNNDGCFAGTEYDRAKQACVDSAP